MADDNNDWKSKRKQEKSLDKLELVPPHSIEAEQALLGAIFLDNDVLNDVIRIVRRPDQFYRAAHQAIYESMLALNEVGENIDWITVSNRLAKSEKLDDAGGDAYLEEITAGTPVAEGAEQYAAIVRDKAVLRSVIQSATQVRGKAYDPTAVPAELIETFEQEVFRLGAERFHSDTHRIQDVLKEVQEQIETFKRMQSEHNALAGLPSGYSDLDKVTTGFKGGELIVLAARPGHGKTALALNIAETIALTAQQRNENKKGGGGCVVFSLEMRASELVSRMLCSLAGVSLRDVRNGKLSHGAENDLEDATARFAASPLFIDDSFTISMPEIRAKCRRLKERYDIECVMVDYIQLISGDGGVDRHELIGRYSRGLKALARELNVPVFGLSQLNRQIEQRRGVQQRPMLSDLRESGSIEQDADMVMFIQRDRMLSAESMKDAQQQADLLEGQDKFDFLDVEPATLVVAKNRSGPIGDVDLTFRKSCTRFESAAKTAHAHFAG